MGRIVWRNVIPMVVILGGFGCGSDEPLQSTAVDCVPVSGRVIAGRQPVAGAIVTFEPKFEWNPELPKPNAVTEADGGFEIGTVMTGDGAPPGEYLVSISSPEGEHGTSVDSQFEDPAKSGLKASIAGKPTKLPDFVVKKGSGTRRVAVK